MADRVDPNDETPSAPFRRVLSLIDGLPAEFKPADDTPLREAMPGGWPTIGEYRAFMAEQTLDKPARIGGVVFRAGVKVSTVIASAQRLYDHSPAPPPTGIAKAPEGPNMAFVADCLRHYAGVLENGVIDTAGHYFPSDIYDAVRQIEEASTPPPSQGEVGT